MQPLMIKIYQDLLLKNELKFMMNQKKIITQTKKLELKHQFSDQIYVILVMPILLLQKLENINDKNEEQLQAIKDQGEKQLKELKNIGNSKMLKAISEISKKNNEANKLLSEFGKIDKTLDNAELLCTKPDGTK